jgi:hypothetical protein
VSPDKVRLRTGSERKLIAGEFASWASLGLLLADVTTVRRQPPVESGGLDSLGDGGQVIKRQTWAHHNFDGSSP